MGSGELSPEENIKHEAIKDRVSGSYGPTEDFLYTQQEIDYILRRDRAVDVCAKHIVRLSIDDVMNIFAGMREEALDLADESSDKYRESAARGEAFYMSQTGK